MPFSNGATKQLHMMEEDWVWISYDNQDSRWSLEIQYAEVSYITV